MSQRSVSISISTLRVSLTRDVPILIATAQPALPTIMAVMLLAFVGWYVSGISNYEARNCAGTCRQRLDVWAYGRCSPFADASSEANIGFLLLLSSRNLHCALHQFCFHASLRR